MSKMKDTATKTAGTCVKAIANADARSSLWISAKDVTSASPVEQTIGVDLL